MTDQRPQPRAQSVNVKGPAAAMLAAAVMIATPMIVVHEGKLNTARLDMLTVQHIITYCYGATGGGVKAGDRFTDAQCKTKLAQDVLSHTRAIVPCIKADISAKTFASFADFSYNLGPANFCGSTLVRKFNAGDAVGACQQISRWVITAGKDCRLASSKCSGLVERRANERALCLEGLS